MRQVELQIAGPNRASLLSTISMIPVTQLNDEANLNCLSLLASLVCVSGAFGQVNCVFYVATTGNHSNERTYVSPLAHCSRGADASRAGSTVNVPGGVPPRTLNRP